MEFQTKYNYAQFDGEKMDPISKTEQAGYVPPKIQIENMILAGRRLSQARLEQFDEYQGQGSLELDPTRRPGLDLAEASILEKQILQNLQGSKNAEEVQKEGEAVEAAQPQAAGTDSEK